MCLVLPPYHLTWKLKLHLLLKLMVSLLE
uniref:Uncharacterized protein n=1 Tax=Arundo donax TaxID=35708 RepID=A0A0A9BR59_ARUDO